MPSVIDYLGRLNRKERFLLLSHVLDKRTDDVFRLDPYFAGKLAAELGLDIPSDAFVAMDYHLDWIQMALHLADKGTKEPIHNPEGSEKLFYANQEDVDLLVAFEDGSTTHLVLIEAKADTGWNNDQLSSKANRLKSIFERPYDICVKPDFVLMSPRRPRRILTEAWPDWTKKKEDEAPAWLELPLGNELIKVTRCDKCCATSENGDHLKVERLREFNVALPVALRRQRPAIPRPRSLPASPNPPT